MSFLNTFGLVHKSGHRTHHEGNFQLHVVNDWTDFHVPIISWMANIFGNYLFELNLKILEKVRGSRLTIDLNLGVESVNSYSLLLITLHSVL
jgi:hypothetical protein